MWKCPQQDVDCWLGSGDVHKIMARAISQLNCTHQAQWSCKIMYTCMELMKNWKNRTDFNTKIIIVLGSRLPSWTCSALKWSPESRMASLPPPPSWSRWQASAPILEALSVPGIVKHSNIPVFDIVHNCDTLYHFHNKVFFEGAPPVNG